MIDIVFYNITDDNITVDKSLGTGVTIQGVFREECSIDQPDILIEGSLDLVKSYNYCWIQYFGRYYYIDKRVSVANSLIRLSMSSDPLMSFKDQLLQESGTIDRNEYLKQGYLLDKGYQALAYKKIVTKAFPNEIEDWSYILMTAG